MLAAVSVAVPTGGRRPSGATRSRRHAGTAPRRLRPSRVRSTSPTSPPTAGSSSSPRRPSPSPTSPPAPLDVTTPANVAYRNQLKARQSSFRQQLKQAAPGAQVERSYQVVLNGMAVDMSAEEAAAVRALPGVRAVTPDIPFQLDMFATPAQIGAPAVWDQLGGQAKAGRGVKVAIIDSGIYVTRDASGAFAGNPCFDDTGYKMPKGFPKGDTRFTNNKVIVARAYFRPDDPPTRRQRDPDPRSRRQPPRHARRRHRRLQRRHRRQHPERRRRAVRRRAGRVPDELPGLLPEREPRGLPERQRLRGRAGPGDRRRRRRRRRRDQQLVGLELPEHARLAGPDGPGGRGRRRRRRDDGVRPGQLRPGRGHRQLARQLARRHRRRRDHQERRRSCPARSTSPRRRRCRPTSPR